MTDLSIDIAGLRFKNPVTTASGTFGYGEEFLDFMDVGQLGGIFVKAVTGKNRDGNPYPRMAETPSGMLNSVSKIVPFPVVLIIHKVLIPYLDNVSGHDQRKFHNIPP